MRRHIFPEERQQWSYLVINHSKDSTALWGSPHGNCQAYIFVCHGISILELIVDLTQLDKRKQQRLYVATTIPSTIALASAYLSNAAHHLTMSSRLFGLEADPSIFWRKTFASLRVHFMFKCIRHMAHKNANKNTTAQHCSFRHHHCLSHLSS